MLILQVSRFCFAIYLSTKSHSLPEKPIHYTLKCCCQPTTMFEVFCCSQTTLLQFSQLSFVTHLNIIVWSGTGRWVDEFQLICCSPSSATQEQNCCEVCPVEWKISCYLINPSAEDGQVDRRCVGTFQLVCCFSDEGTSSSV